MDKGYGFKVTDFGLSQLQKLTQKVVNVDQIAGMLVRFQTFNKSRGMLRRCFLVLHFQKRGIFGLMRLPFGKR